MFKRYSSLSKPLWAKYNLKLESFKVSTINCFNIDDLKHEILQEIPNQLRHVDVDEITIHSSLNDTALAPDAVLVNITEAGMSARTPLFVHSLF